MKRLFIKTIIMTLALLAVFIRFTALEGREFFNIDEFSYYQGATLSPLLKGLIFKFQAALKSGELFPKYILGLAKNMFPDNHLIPTYIFISMISGTLMGVRPESAFYQNAALSLATLAVVFLLTRRLFSNRAALIATVLMAFSPTFLFYSRSGLWVSSTIFFFTFSVFFYVKSRMEEDRGTMNRILCGLFLGLAGTAHPVYFVPGLIYPLLEMQRLFEKKDIIKGFLNGLSIATSCAFVILLWEVPYFLVHTYFALTGRIPVFKNYYTSMILINNMHTYVYNFSKCFYTNASVYKSQERTAYDSIYFLKHLNLSEGVGFTFIAILSLVFLAYTFIRKKTFNPLLVVLWVAIPYLFFTQSKFIMQTRHYMCTLPAIFIAVGYFCDALLVSKRKMLLAIFVSVFTVYTATSFFINDNKVIRSKLCLKPIAEYIEKNKLDDIMVNSVVMWWNCQELVVRNLSGFKTWLRTVNPAWGNVSAVKSTRYVDKIVLPRHWLYWIDVEEVYRKKQIRYFITNLTDADVSFPPAGIFKKAKPLACVDTPHFIYMPGVYDSKSYGEAQTYFSNDSLRYVALYDLDEVLK